MKKRSTVRTVSAVAAATLVAMIGFASNKGAAAGGPPDERLPLVASLKRDVAKPTPDQKRLLREIAARFAAANGAGAAHSGHVVATTRGAANALDTGATVDTNQDVFMVTLRGNFVAQFLSARRSGPKPTGSILSFVYDPDSGQVTDISVGPVHPDLALLGEVEPLED